MARPRFLSGKGSRLRLSALIALLLLALASSALLAWRAVHASRQQRTLAEQTLHDYADYAAYILANGVYREYGTEVLSSFAALDEWGTPALFEASPTPGCTNGFYFEYNLGTARFVRGGRDRSLPPGAEQHLRDTLAYSAALLNEAEWRFRFIQLDLGDAGNGVFITAEPRPGGLGIRGLSACPWTDSTFVRYTRRWSALPPALTRAMSADSLYAVSLGRPGGDTIYVSPAWFPPEFVGTAPLGTEFGDLALSVALNPDLAPDLVIGGLPPSGLPDAVGLFALSALLLLAAALQLRREYQTIAARSEFVSRVSHELRTPLSQILIFTELLKLGRLRSPEERDRSLTIIDQETRRLIRLVENVLQFSRAGTVPAPVPDELDLSPVIEQAVEAFRPLADVREVSIEVDVPPSLRVRVDRHSLRQVVVNLLDNAVKYGPTGQVVRVEAAARDVEVQLTVEDQGPGIPIDQRDRIWDGFARLERENVSAVSGSGIGLSVVRSLVEGMGGRVAVMDSSTGGARFCVSMPGANGDRAHP